MAVVVVVDYYLSGEVGVKLNKSTKWLRRFDDGGDGSSWLFASGNGISKTLSTQQHARNIQTFFNVYCSHNIRPKILALPTPRFLKHLDETDFEED